MALRFRLVKYDNLPRIRGLQQLYRAGNECAKSTQMTRATSMFRGSRGRRGFAETLLVPQKGADGQK